MQAHVHCPLCGDMLGVEVELTARVLSGRQEEVTLNVHVVALHTHLQERHKGVPLGSRASYVVESS